MNFLKYLLQLLKFCYEKKFKSSKYILSGKCRQCGHCCRNIVFVIGENRVCTEKQFELLKNFKEIYHHFYISGKDTDGALLFTCKSLSDDNKCKDYKIRSLFCRNYPQIIPDFIYNGGTPFDCCGYKFKINKKFEDFLK